ncbi:hypothetical protein F5148DRAFT_466834 [Russula earlei]|uniref:Uncharacterized protein n=1 Tax=Russula earlei TaxID=71964 RepID=A0ACC0UNC2_9AGAM|nr:hypothetical protein F5148DRAFT_466834 [Russula earlei]
MSGENCPSSADDQTLPSIRQEVETAQAPLPGHTRGASDRRSSLNQALETRENDTTEYAPTARQLTPKQRFRSAVRKVIAIHFTYATLRGRRGAEPGVDPRSHSAFAAYGQVHQRCVIDIIDYSSARYSSGRMTNKGFIEFLQNDQASAREPWAKVRWINIGGISWDVISALALKYDLHPLSVEDVLHWGGHALSKADYYPKHLFIRVLCHSLVSTAAMSQSPETASSSHAVGSSSLAFTDPLRSASLNRLDEKLGMGDQYAYENACERDVGPMDDWGTGRATVDPEMGGRAPSPLVYKRRRAVAELTLDELKKGDRVGVHIEPMCIFLCRDGTVISFTTKPNLDLTKPIAARIWHRDTSLRTAADPSLLVESLLDLAVDAALEVVDEYRERLSLLERMILTKSKVSTVRSLHILSGDLILHKRTLGPVRALVYALRNYDIERTAACLNLSTSGDQKVDGYMSHRATVYLADVLEHIEYTMSSLDMYSAMTENLINYAFNLASYETNEVMRRLTLCTILFLPLTGLTGYFGMNFENMWSIHHGHSDIFFWFIAIPLLCIVAPSFMWSDIVGLYHYFKKRSLARKVTKRFKRE